MERLLGIMASEELKKALESINSPLAEAAKKLESELNPLKGLLSQQESVRELLAARPVMPELTKFEIPVNQNLASEFYKRLAQWIQDFDANLDQEYEVGVRLVSFGQAVTFHLHNMGYWNPSLISFQGITDQGDPVELIQRVSQISVLLIKVKRTDTSQPKRPIGFASWGDSGENQT
jgi:hypothetical protein